MSAPEPAAPRVEDIPAEWLAEFEAAARRPLRTRFRYAFIHTYKPVLDDEPFRAFDTTADYRGYSHFETHAARCALSPRSHIQRHGKIWHKKAASTVGIDCTAFQTALVPLLVFLEYQG